MRLLGFRLKTLFKELTVVFGILACATIGPRIWSRQGPILDLGPSPPWYEFISGWGFALVCFGIFVVSFALSGWGRLLKRCIPLLGKLAIGVGILLIVLTLFVLEENVRGKMELDMCLRQLRARGEKVTWAEMNLPKQAIEGNGVSTLLALTNRLYTLRKDCPSYLYAVHPGIQLVPSGHAIVRSDQPDLGVNRIPGSYERQGRSRTTGRPVGRRQYEEEPDTISHPPIKADWADLDSQVRKASSLLEEVRTLLSRPLPPAKIDYTQGLGNVRLPHLVITGPVANWFALAALSEIHSRNLEAASRDIASIAGLTHIGQDELLIDSQTYRCQVGLTGLGVTWEALQRAGWTDAQLLALQQAWQESGVVEGTSSTLEIRRLFYRDWFRQARHAPTWKSFVCTLFYDSQAGWPPAGLKEMLSDLRDGANGIMWSLAWYEQDELRFLRRYQLFLDRARDAVTHEDWSTFKLSEKDLPGPRTAYDRWRFLLSDRFVTEGIGLPLRPIFEYEAQREMTVAAIAINRYQLRAGALPPDLAALVPAYLSQLPRDWMDGKSLRYRTNPDGTFILYSVGLDGRDDGGDPTPMEGKRAYSIWNERDTVWPSPASSEEIIATQQRR